MALCNFLNGSRPGLNAFANALSLSTGNVGGALAPRQISRALPTRRNQAKSEDMNTLFEAPRDRAVPSSARSQTNPSSHILVVDDDGEILRLSAGALVLFGYRVDAAKDGAAAWKALHANSYDLLITDNNMAKLSGVELVKKLRSARMTLPVILASRESPAEELDRNPGLQLAATLVKPFSSGQLLETVRQVLLAADNATSRTAAFFPVPAANIRQITPASQWGINE